MNTATAENVAITQQACSDIQQRIAELAALGDEDLKGAMDELKRALMDNPAACSLMLPEDIGQMVVALRRITGTALVTATKPKSKAAKAKSIQELLDAPLPDDF